MLVNYKALRKDLAGTIRQLNTATSNHTHSSYTYTVCNLVDLTKNVHTHLKSSADT